MDASGDGVRRDFKLIATIGIVSQAPERQAAATRAIQTRDRDAREEHIGVLHLPTSDPGYFVLRWYVETEVETARPLWARNGAFGAVPGEGEAKIYLFWE
jgi:hypothetical protein